MLQGSVKKALDKAYKLLQVSDVDRCVEEYAKLFERLENIQDVVYAKEVAEKVIRYKGKCTRRSSIKKRR